MGNLTVITPKGQRAVCPLRLYDSYGIDRDNDGHPNPDIKKEVFYTDETFIGHLFERHNGTRIDGTDIIWLEFFAEGECRGCMGDGSQNLFNEDEIVTAANNCVTQPSRQGWYRWYGHLNGSNDGDLDDYQDDWRTENWFGDDPTDPAGAYSHWYYICECANRSDAEQKLGVPPQYHPDRDAAVRAPNYEPGLNLTLYHPGSRTRPLPTETAAAPPTPSPTPTTASPATPTQTATASSPASDGEAAGFGGLLALLALLGGGLIVIIASLYR